MSRRRVLAGGLAVLALLAGGCAAGASGRDSGTLTVAVANDPGNLHPLMTAARATRYMARFSYDSLIYPRENGTFAPGIAEGWRITPTAVTFTLKQGVTCSDGSGLTATDVADNLRFILDPKNKSPQRGVFLPAAVSVESDAAAATVTVRSPSPNGFLINGLANIFIVCRAGLDNPALLKQKTIGTGPWVLQDAVPDDHYLFVPHQGYTWGPDGENPTGPGAPKRVNVRVVANQTTTANLMLAGEINLATVGGIDRTRLDGAKLPALQTVRPAGETFFNQTAGRPTADRAVREALATGLDIDKIAKIATSATGRKSVGLATTLPKVCPGDTVTGTLPDYDPAQAQRLLDAAGWRPGPDGVRVKDGQPLAVTFLYPAAEGDAVRAGAELVAKMWTEIGVLATLRAVTSNQLIQTAFTTGDWDAAWLAISVTLPSQLVPFLSGAEPPAGNNFAHLRNADYPGLTGQAAALTGQESCDRWNDAEIALLKNVDVLPMFDQIDKSYLRDARARAGMGELWTSSLRFAPEAG
jgi:peptide/nickel transport system substrate-binding protein